MSAGERHEDRARRQLQRLYDISKLLTSFLSVDRTVPEVIAIVAQTLHLRNAIFILETAGVPRTMAWQTPGNGADGLQAALAHAKAAYAYLVHSERELGHDLGKTIELPQRPTDGRDGETEAAKGHFVLLPLVVDHGPIFGALQLEGADALDELDLAFVSAVVNQLAIAIDRQAVISARQAATEASETEQRLLAEVSAALASSLEFEKALARVARVVIPVVADLCFVDVMGEDGAVRRVEALFADEQKQRELADLMLRAPPRPGGPTPQGKVLDSGEPLLLDLTDPAPERVAHDEEHAEVMRAAAVRSMMIAPLLARGKRLGALTFAAAESGRRYSTRDLAFAQEIAHRTAIAIDNARLYEKSQRATRAREDLLAVVSHDLRNPLGVILMNVAVMRLGPFGQEREGHKRLASIERAADQMNRLIGGLLDAASIEAGRLSVELGRLRIAPLVSEALESLQALAESKSLHLERELPAELPDVAADAARVHQVLANLIGNAIKFTPGGGTITVRAEPSDDTVTFSVADTGPGIEEEDLHHLFSRYWQAKRTARLGTGLGLFIVKGIVEAHGGEVWVESEVGAGTTFYFTLRVFQGAS